jgi:hypothetical protein
VEQDLQQSYAQSHPGQVQVIGADMYNGTPSQLQGFKNATGATYPLLLLAATASGGNLATLYGPFDNYVVINKQGIVRYHAATRWPHGNRYHLDEIRACVDSLVTNVTGVGDGTAASLSLAPSPNPFRGRTEIALTLAAGGDAHVTVHDLAGRRLATLADGPLPAGVTRLEWRGLDDAGATQPAGVYLIRAVSGGGRASRRVVRLP